MRIKKRPEWEKRLLDLKIRVMKLAPIHEIPSKRRGKASEVLVEFQLLKYGSVAKPQKEAHFVGDRVCEIELEDGTVNRVPIEVKSVTIENPLREFHITRKFLLEFEGVYVIVVQRKEQPKEYDFLVLTSGEMRWKVLANADLRMHDKARKKKRWYVRVPENLEGFELSVDRWNKIANYVKKNKEIIRTGE